MDKWKLPEKYNWGEIYRLKDEYRDSDKLKYLEEDFWFIGAFDERGINHEKHLDQVAKKDFGLKYWEFKKNVSKQHESKVQRNCTEYNFVLEGEIQGSIEKEKDIILQAGDFIVTRPGFVINLQEKINKDTKGITIKVPLIEDDEIKKSKFN
jgi:hypothetical protein